MANCTGDGNEANDTTTKMLMDDGARGRREKIEDREAEQQQRDFCKLLLVLESRQVRSTSSITNGS
jgi:hypothetical protein